MLTPFSGLSTDNENINSSAGYIVNIIDNGCGFICSLDGKEDNVFAPENELFNQGYSASIGDIVCFHKRNSETSQPKAANIQWIGWEKPQERADLLFAVARLGNPRNWLFSLANLAEKESWSSKPENPHQKDILMSYIQHTFIRLYEMNDAVSFFDFNETRYMAFNTGLNSRFHLRDGRLTNIYAVFIYRANQGRYQAWELVEFLPSDECRRKYGIRPDLPVADYGQYNLTLFNPTLPVDTGSFHILVERAMRLPEEIQGYSREHQEDLLQAAIKKALLRVQQNYTIATLQFFRDKKQSGELQWLIPFRWSLNSASILAMPLQIGQDAYTCKTLLYLHMAYKNARLIRQPAKTEWLSSFME